VAAALDTEQLPATLLKQTHKIFTRNGFHTAISSNLAS
jgi:hypothetical protein